MTAKTDKNYLFLFSKENPELAYAECQALHPDAHAWIYAEDYATAKLSCLHASHLAYTKQVFEIIKAGSLGEIKEYVSRHPLRQTKETFSFKRICVNKEVEAESEVLSSSETRSLLLNYVLEAHINLTQPDNILVLVCAKELYYLAQQVWENKENFTQRKNQFRPAPHPTSLNPKLARALINLLNPEEGGCVLDPFCGSGGILIESSLMGFKTLGMDNDPIMIRRAEKNLSFFHLSADLRVGDARKNLFDVDYIITDLPYGKNSKADNLEELYKSFLQIAKKYTKNMLIAAPSSINTKKIILEAAWRVEKFFSWPLNKSLTKEIFVLSRED